MSSLYEAGDVTTQKELKFNSTTSSTSNNDLFSTVNSSNNHDDASKDANNNVVMSSNNKNDDDGYDYSNKIITMEQILAGTQFLDSKYDNRNDNNNNSDINNNRNDDTNKDDDIDNTSRTYNKYFNYNDDNDEPKDYPNNITFPSSTSSSPNYPDHLYAHISKIHRGWESDAQSPMRDDEDRDNNNRDSQFDDNRNDNDNSDNNNYNNSTTNNSDKSIDKNKNRSSNNNNSSSSSSRVKNRREETEEERELREEREKKEFIDALRKAREEEDRIRERILKIDVVTPLISSSSSSSSSSSKLGRVFAGEGDMIEEYELEKKKRSALEILEEAKRGKLLREVDHSKIQYAPFRKNLYIVPRALNKLSEAEVIEKREDIQLKVRGRGCPSPVDNWEQCGLSDRILQTIHSLQLKEPFAIQRQAIPAIMCGRDVIGVAKTGSGKTLAFLLPMLRHILDQPPLLDGEGPIGLVMAPARELAFQIYNEAKKFTKPLGLRVTAIYGKYVAK